MRAPFLLRAACALLLCLLTWNAPAYAQANPIEREVKAAYLYKFASFVEWPEGSFARADSALQIGVAGNDALAEQLEQMVGERPINGHLVTVRRVRRGESLAGLHVLFVGSMEKGAMAELLGAARGRSLLTVSDSDEAHLLGSMVNLVLVDDKLRFEVALRPVASSRLRISARMLAAARKVQQEAS